MWLDVSNTNPDVQAAIDAATGCLNSIRHHGELMDDEITRREQTSGIFYSFPFYNTKAGMSGVRAILLNVPLRQITYVYCDF